MRKLAVLAVCVMALAVGAAAWQSGQATGQGAASGSAMGQGGGQAMAGTPNLVSEVLAQYTAVSTNAVNAADRFPEDKYTWVPPVPAQPDNASIRSWAQLVAHMTDDANANCWSVAGLSAAPARTENATPGPNQKSKADLVAGFKAAVGVCKDAFAKLTPENMLESAGGRGNVTKIGRLITITAHANEHYGNMVVYYRLLGLVPPSTADRGRRGGLPR